MDVKLLRLKSIPLILQRVRQMLPGVSVQAFLFLLFVASPAFAQDTLTHVKLPNGWSLSPVGKQIPVGDLPLNIAISPDHNYAAVTNNGESEHSIQLIDLKEQKLLDTHVVGKAWLGLVFGDKGIYRILDHGFDNRPDPPEGSLRLKLL